MAHLLIIEGPLSGSSLVLESRLTIGRSPLCDLYLDENNVSRHHAEIQKKQDFFVLIDQGSANGTIINGTDLHKLVPRPLYEDDKITIGSTVIVFSNETNECPKRKEVTILNEISDDSEMPCQKQNTVPEGNIRGSEDVSNSSKSESKIEAKKLIADRSGANIQERVRGTILVCGISGFTELSEILLPAELFDIYHKYQSISTKIVDRNNGVLAEFNSENFIAFWRDDNEKCIEQDAVRSSLELQNAFFALNTNLCNMGLEPLMLRIGCNTGMVTYGDKKYVTNVGCIAIGNAVHNTRVVESFACSSQIIVTSDTFRQVKDRSFAKKICSIIVNGSKMPVEIFSIRGISDADGSLLVSIPVRIMGSDGEVCCSGLITRYRGISGSEEIELLLAHDLLKSAKLIIQIDIQELERSFHIEGETMNTSLHSQNGQKYESEIVLKNLTGDIEVLNYFRPGMLVEGSAIRKNLG